MRISKDEFVKYVNTYHKMLEQENTITETLDINEWICSDWINNYYIMLDNLCELPVDNDIGTVLDWFCFETDFGNGDCKISSYDESINAKKVWYLTTPEKLYDYIVENNIRK